MKSVVRDFGFPSKIDLTLFTTVLVEILRNQPDQSKVSRYQRLIEAEKRNFIVKNSHRWCLKSSITSKKDVKSSLDRTFSTCCKYARALSTVNLVEQPVDIRGSFSIALGKGPRFI